jgi:hypothetical protein
MFGIGSLITMFFPVITSIIARKKSGVFIWEMRLFEVYVYATLIFQLIAHIMTRVFSMHNIIVFRIYLPFHTFIFAFFLLKWLGLKKYYTTIAFFMLICSIVIDYLLGDQKTAPYVMIWLDTIILLVLSFLVSYRNDKYRKRLSDEFNEIHIGIYLYSLITLIGVSLSGLEIQIFGYAAQTVATLISNVYFARSFRCLYL